mmetsp:Transcript_34652/g.56653  ORF Transcript_34652/g.56653 Transcript_34652/m.56653 type:complete len:209 (-) Transcript_34652:189-815(-)
MVLLSKHPDNKKFPRLFHFKLNIGPRCPFRVCRSSPFRLHTRTTPSYLPVANSSPLLLHSSVVTSLFFLSLESCPCGNSILWRHPPLASLPLMAHIRAEASPEPVAMRFVKRGFQAHMNTSEVCWESSITSAGWMAVRRSSSSMVAAVDWFCCWLGPVGGVGTAAVGAPGGVPPAMVALAAMLGAGTPMFRCRGSWWFPLFSPGIMGA